MRKFIKDYWDPYSGGIKTIVQLLLYMAVYFSFASFQNPVVGGIVLILAVVGGIISIYRKMLYRAGDKSYFLIPTKNDEYSKMTALVLGGIFVILAIVYFWLNHSFLLPIAGAIVGSVIFINGLYSLPGCRVDVSNNQITIGATAKEVDVRQLKQIEILPDRLTLTNIYDEPQRVDNLNLDMQIAAGLAAYLKENINNPELAIVIVLEQERLIMYGQGYDAV